MIYVMAEGLIGLLTGLLIGGMIGAYIVMKLNDWDKLK
jgi:hypothetical protein